MTSDRKKGNWTEKEDDHILSLQSKLGNQWTKIAAGLPGRSDNDVKNRWHSRARALKRKEAKTGSTGQDPSDLPAKRNNRKRAKPPQRVAPPEPKVPKVGHKVEVKSQDDKMLPGKITKVAKQAKKRKNEPVYKLSIRYDNGTCCFS